MIGSETFIIVALRWSDSRASSSAASSMVRLKKARRAATFMTAASTTSPASSGTLALRTVTAPPASTNSMRASHGCSRVTERSLPKKSFSCMWATRVFDPDAGHAFIIRCGCFCANRFTAAAGRRSEFPSRRTGFTADPSTAAYRACTARSSSPAGSSG